MADHALDTVELPQTVSRYTKALAYIVAAALAVLVVAFQDDRISLGEWVQLVVVVVGAIGVYLVPLVGYLKGVVAFLAAGLSVIGPVIEAGGIDSLGDISTSVWLTVLLAALGGIGVVILPNTPATVELPPEPVLAELADDGEYVDPDEYDAAMAKVDPTEVAPAESPRDLPGLR